MKILILDNNIDPEAWGSRELREQVMAAGVPRAVISTRRPPAGDLPAGAAAWDAVILSGSKTAALETAPWIEALDRFVARALDEDVPLLGVCYGHQTLARVLGSRSALRVSPTPELGWTSIQRIADDALWENLPTRFHTYSWHRDEVGQPPPGTRLLARSERCAVQAFAVEGRRARGIQFHPERGIEAGERSIAKTAPSDQPHILGRGQGRKLHSAEVGRLIFSNFLNKIAARK